MPRAQRTRTPFSPFPLREGGRGVRFARYHLTIALLLLPLACAAEDTVLARTMLDGAEIQLLRSADAKLTLKIATTPEPLSLATAPWTDGKGLRADQLLAAEIFALPAEAQGAQAAQAAQGLWVRFGLDDGNGGVRSVAALLTRVSKSAPWTLAHEWSADSVALGELGFKREKLSVSADPSGAVTRTHTSVSVEGVAHKLDCGCTACQSRTTAIDETELLQWNPATHAYDAVRHEKWYIAQPGENIMTAVRKSLGDARLITRVARLNPQIKDGTTFAGGEKVLVLREEAGGK